MGGVPGEGALEYAEYGDPLFVVIGLGFGYGAGLLEFDTLVQQQGGIAAVVRIMFGPLPSGQLITCSVHHQYSSMLSPFQA